MICGKKKDGTWFWCKKHAVQKTKKQYRTVPYRFSRWTVKVDCTAYRTFLTVFRDFYLKARTLPRFKYFRFTVLTQIFRLSANRTVPTHLPFFVILTLKILFWWSLLEKREPYRDEFLHEKSLKIDIYAERFALTALFSCKKWNF